MSKKSSVTAQVKEAIANAHKNVNSASQLAPADESQLRAMSSEIKEKIDDLIIADQTLSNYLKANGKPPAHYS